MTLREIRQLTRLTLDPKARNCVPAIFMEKHPPTYTVTDGTFEYAFFVPSARALSRAISLFQKEPDTIEWINGFAAGDTFYDVGANVGAFTIYAACRKNVRVYAFEPAFHNYYLLNKNIKLNKLDQVRAFNLAFSNTSRWDRIFLKTTADGDAGVNLGESVDHTKTGFEPTYVQPVFSSTLDDFLIQHGDDFPNHIKIDVDGREPEIIEVADQTLRDPRLKSLLIEVHEGDASNLQMVQRITATGFKTIKSPLARYQGKNFINYIFAR
jgi:FkbM family methyltransferase